MVEKRVLKVYFTNRWLYSIIALALIFALTLGVYALTAGTKPNPGHLIGEVAPSAECQTGQVLTWQGSDWSCTTISGGTPSFNGGYLFYFNNDRLGRILKNSATASAVTSTGSLPSIYAFGYTKIEGGKLYTRVCVGPNEDYCYDCDGGGTNEWVDRATSSCISTIADATGYVTATYNGVVIKRLEFYDPDNPICTSYCSERPWI
ncbi:MAG: hypothetical protein AABX30_00580 [Nanoarchaeota archaeon]